MPEHRSRRRLLAGCLVMLAATHAGTPDAAGTGGFVRQATPSPQLPVAGLGALLEPGLLLADDNGDGHVDFVRARLELPPAPSDAEVAAAANVAARLGHETASMDLPLPRADGDASGPVIAVGRAVLAAGGESEPPLEPGQGNIELVDGEPLRVEIAGGDDAGTTAAALFFAARLPHLWSADDASLGDVSATVATVLQQAGVATTGPAIVRRLRVRAGQAGVDRLDVEVSVQAGELAEAAESLRRAGQEPAENAAAMSEDAAPGVPASETGANATSEASTQTAVPTLRFSGLRLLRVVLRAADGPGRSVWLENPGGTPDGGGRRPGGGSKGDLDLSNLYTNDGFFSDTDGNLIPDRVDVVLTAAGDPAGGTVDLAARLGLEAAGITLPLAVAPGSIERPASEPPLVVIGRQHPLIEELVEDERVMLPELGAGQGWIGVVREAFGDRTALLVLGADAAGQRRALEQLATRFPHLWDRGKDRPTVEDVEDALWRAISARSPIGQAATALYKLDTMAASLATRQLAAVRVGVHVEKADEGLQAFVERYARERFAAADIVVEIDNLDVQDARTIIDEEIDIESEVDAFWERFRAEVLPEVVPGAPVFVEARLSEPPEIRQAIADQARRELESAGAAPEVRILSAYKQGYSWLNDAIRPQLAGREIGTITIRFAEVGAPEAWPQQAMYTPTRWLLEIFPIDEVLARELDLDLEQIGFEKMPRDAPAYEVIATDAAGDEILREAFEPRWVLRDYFDRFPDYEKARVTTGWIRADVAGRTVVDERIVTDLERFWDHFQSDTLMRIYDYVMSIGEGKPRAQDAPHFGELRIDVTLSEPDYQVGVDKEQIASMEALHEEIYFGTLHFFDVLGRLARGQALSYPGRVIPVVRPKADGRPGSAKISFTGFAAARPMVVVEFEERDGTRGRLRRDLPEVEIDRPQPLEAFFDDGSPGVGRLGFYVQVDFEQDRRAEFLRRTSARSIDARITNAAQTRAVVANTALLRDAGLYRSALAFAGLGQIDLAVGWEHERSPETELVVSLAANGTPPAAPSIGDWLPAAQADGPLVQWDTPIPPDEAYSILARMAAYPQATAYQVGESYLGKPIWAIDLMAPLAGSHWSQAKATTLKPTVVYSARQHANEVSSTSHVLKLGELILTDPAYADVLDRVNVVIHPITNPDGAQLAYDLHQITPDHMLHAGYLGALGVDVTSGQGSEDPIYPETNIRPKIWSTWLPDLFLNPHGYPSHEWVQVFSEYAGWVRTRATESRGWWGMRGWFMPGFSYLDDPRYPRHKDAAFEIRDRITEKINAAAGIRSLNERAYDRYRRYAFAWDPENFKLDFTDDVLIYTPIVGASGRNGTMSNPRVTVWSGSTEAPDETAYGDWLQLVATGGLEWDKALLEYLLEGDHRVNRTRSSFSGGVTFHIDRPRPPEPAEEGAEARQ